MDRIRKIRREGWPEIQESVLNDDIGIDMGYKLIRDMELGNDDNRKRRATAHIKAAKSLLSEENFAFLDQLGGDVGDHVNKALELYMRSLRGRMAQRHLSLELGAARTLNRKDQATRTDISSECRGIQLRRGER